MFSKLNWNVFQFFSLLLILFKNEHDIIMGKDFCSEIVCFFCNLRNKLTPLISIKICFIESYFHLFIFGLTKKEKTEQNKTVLEKTIQNILVRNNKIVSETFLFEKVLFKLLINFFFKQSRKILILGNFLGLLLFKGFISKKKFATIIRMFSLCVSSKANFISCYLTIVSFKSNFKNFFGTFFFFFIRQSKFFRLFIKSGFFPRNFTKKKKNNILADKKKKNNESYIAPSFFEKNLSNFHKQEIKNVIVVDKPFNKRRRGRTVLMDFFSKKIKKFFYNIFMTLKNSKINLLRISSIFFFFKKKLKNKWIQMEITHTHLTFCMEELICFNFLIKLLVLLCKEDNRFSFYLKNGIALFFRNTVNGGQIFPHNFVILLSFLVLKNVISFYFFLDLCYFFTNNEMLDSKFCYKIFKVFMENIKQFISFLHQIRFENKHHRTRWVMWFNYKKPKVFKKYLYYFSPNNRIFFLPLKSMEKFIRVEILINFKAFGSEYST